MNTLTKKRKRQLFVALWRTVKTNAFWSDVIIFICGLLFLYSAGDKLLAYETFRVQVGKSPILTGYEDFVAWCVPSIELLIVFMMVPLATRQLGLYAFFALMLLFTGYITLLLLSDLVIPCGCNALTEKLSLEAHIVMNSAFSTIAAIGVFISPTPNLQFQRAHALYRGLLNQTMSSIQPICSAFKRKEAKDKKD